MTTTGPDKDLNRLTTVLAAVFPDLQPIHPLTILGRGFRSLALETGSGVVVKVGLNRDAGADYLKEWLIGDFLAERLGALVPRPLWFSGPRDGLPYGALCYTKLPGDCPAWGMDPGSSFATDLGEFMVRLHHLPVGEARAAGLPDVDAYGRLLGVRDVVMPLLSARLAPQAFSRVTKWWEGFAMDRRLRTDRVAACHHDLWHSNLLRSTSGRLTGVLDLAHVELTDPAHDFAAPQSFGEAFFERLVTAYLAAGGELDSEDVYRARRFFEAREFGGLAWAIEHDDDSEVEDAIRKILNGPLFAE